jgi:hypothetical protein
VPTPVFAAQPAVIDPGLLTVAEHDEQLAEIVPVLAGAVQVDPGGFGKWVAARFRILGATSPRTASWRAYPAPRRRALAAISVPDPANSGDEFPPAGRINVGPARYRRSMRYLMLMWADADAASGDESDFAAWAEFDEQVKAAGAFVLNGALTPASAEARLVQTAIAGHAIGDAVERRPFAAGKRQIQAFYIMDLPGMDAALEWANRLPTYGYVEVRELLQF